MSSHYNTEPPPTASVTLVTTVGPLYISLFAKQTPLACKNFVQHCLDGYYVGSPFHRVVRGFILQGGDPSGLGFGGSSIYEDPEFEYDPEGQDPSENVVFADELHSHLRCNRRGMVGMAKSEDGTYGSQFFITLANVERELNSKCTLFGRVEGDGIYNVVKIAEAELIEGTDRPIYPVLITGCEVGELGPFQGKLKKRDKIAVPSSEESAIAIKKKKKVKGGKTLLSFGTDDIVEGGLAVRPSKPKFNTRLTPDQEPKKQQETRTETRSEQRARKRPRSKSPLQTSQNHIHRPKTPDPYTQLPLPGPEAPHRSPSLSPSSPLKASALDRTNAEIASLKASMRWNIAPVAPNISKKKSALEAMIPAASICGRKRHPLDNNTTTGCGSSADADTLKRFNEFKAKLEGADAGGNKTEKVSSWSSGQARVNNGDSRDVEEEDKKAQLCDLHFIANCQSCKA
ncbi:Cyclophilin-like domain containing protein [Elaphomyces granulatus]